MTINDLQAEIKDLWNKMCAHDGITEAAQFVVFSDDNPFQSRYDNRLRMLLAIRRNMRG